MGTEEAEALRGVVDAMEVAPGACRLAAFRRTLAPRTSRLPDFWLDASSKVLAST